MNASMKKAMHPTTQEVYAVIKKRFKKGVVLSYALVGDEVGVHAETARQHAIKLQKKRLVSIKAGHIVGVK